MNFLQDISNLQTYAVKLSYRRVRILADHDIQSIEFISPWSLLSPSLLKSLPILLNAIGLRSAASKPHRLVKYVSYVYGDR